MIEGAKWRRWVFFYLPMAFFLVFFIFPIGFFYEGQMLPASLYGWSILFGLAFISHAGGQGLLSVALGRLPAVFSSLVIFLEAIVGAGMGWLVLNEALTPVQFAGGALILFGIWVARPRSDAA